MRRICLTILAAMLAVDRPDRLIAEVDFDTQVIPILTKAGCNSGACHGAAAGRGDFRLSLFGSRPAADHDALVRELEGRRANLIAPEQSLLLAKPTLMLTHEGGMRLEPDSWETRQLLTWLQAGATRSSERSLIDLSVQSMLRPEADSIVGHATAGTAKGTEVDVAHVPVELELVVWATYRDESSQRTYRENVTRLAVVTSHDPDSLEYIEPSRGAWRKEDAAARMAESEGGNAAVVGEGGMGLEGERGHFRIHRGGRHVAAIRFLNRMETVSFTAPLGEVPIDDRTSDRKGREHNAESWIDREIDATLKQLRLPASPTADDLRLLRRVTLHLTGRLPTLEDISSYLAEPEESRYEQRVEKLLESVAAEEYWTWHLARMLRLRRPGNELPALAAIHLWLREQWRQQAGWNETMRDLLLAEGDSHELGPASFYRMAPDARLQAEYVSETLWGIRLRCANCHDHPLDRWTQDDYHGLAAIFAKIDRGQVVRAKSTGEVIHPATGEAAMPRLPGARFLDPREDERRELVEWLSSADQPLLARAMVNRIWKSLMGRGLIEPVDDLRETNPPTHPRLLSQLEDHFQSEGYRLRPLIRTIVLSQAYQRGAASEGNDDDDRFYSHRLTNQLSPEVLADAVSDVTGIWNRYGDEPLGTRAISLIDPQTPSEALDRLGRCTPLSSSCNALSPPATQGVSTRLHLLNGALLNEKITAPSGRLHRELETWRAARRGPETDLEKLKDLEDLIDLFYRRALTRLPSEPERGYWRKQFLEADDVQIQGIAEDFLWSLLNCHEFVTNR